MPHAECSRMDRLPAHFNFARDVIDRWPRERPDAPALWWVDEAGTQQKFSFRQLAELSRRAASAFSRAGLKPGDRALIILPRVPQWWIAMLSVIRLGAVPIPATPLLTARDLSY